MQSDKQLTKLRDLAQLDVDAIGLYEAAIQRIDVPVVREKLMEFRADHARHVQDLKVAIVKLGGTQIEEKPDVKGSILRGFTAISSMMGTQPALIAMIGNEELNNRSYQSALKLDWLPDERALIEKNHSDEQRHLAWIKQASKEKIWAKESGAQAH